MSTFAATKPLTRMSAPEVCSTGGRTVSRRRLTSCVVDSSWGPFFGSDDPADCGRIRLIVGLGPDDRLDLRIRVDRFVHRRERADLLGVVDRGDEVDRSGGALAEAVDDEVVRALGRRLVGEVALVGEPEPQAEEGDGEHEKDHGADDGPGPRVVLNDTAPSIRGGLAARLGRPVAARRAAAGRGRTRGRSCPPRRRRRGGSTRGSPARRRRGRRRRSRRRPVPATSCARCCYRRSRGAPAGA